MKNTLEMIIQALKIVLTDVSEEPFFMPLMMFSTNILQSTSFKDLIPGIYKKSIIVNVLECW